MKTPKPIKWENIKVGQDYYTEYLKNRKFTKIGDMKVRGYYGNGHLHDFDIDTISKCNHYLWEDRIKLKGNCKHCKWIEKIFPDIKDMTNREYWIMTEVFVYLHDGKDYCDGK